MSFLEIKTIEAMENLGGSFMRALAALYLAADPENRKRIKETWPDEWEKYSQLGLNTHPEPFL